MSKAARVCVAVLTAVTLCLIAVMAIRAFTALIVSGVNYLGGEGAVSESAAPPWAAPVTTLAPGDDPSWADLPDQVPVDITAEELGRAVTQGAQSDTDPDAEDQ